MNLAMSSDFCIARAANCSPATQPSVRSSNADTSSSESSIHPLAGVSAVAESVQVITSPNASVNDGWIVARKSVDGSTRRFVEYFAEGFEQDDDIEGAVFLDSSLEFDGAVNETLQPGAGAITRNATNVSFTVTSSFELTTEAGDFLLTEADEVHRMPDGGQATEQRPTSH